jgi:hypothetical protein
MIISTSAAIEPIVLGQGRLNKAVNLNMGAKHSPITPYFGSNGFAAPNAPQPMEVDPGAMVSQSGRLKDQSQAFRDQSAAIYNNTGAVLNRTMAVAEDVRMTGIKVEALKKQADLSASSSLQSSLLARDYLNNTRMLYNRTKITARNIEMAASMDIIDGKSTAKYVGSSANNVESLQQQISFLSQRLDVLERRVYDLESGKQGK